VTTDLEQPSSEHDQAFSRLKKRRDLSAHAFSYLVVNAALWAIWATTDGGYPWPAWISGLWGIGLLMNAWEALVRKPITEADVQREVERLRPQH
jgi:hypothetical protein